MGRAAGGGASHGGGGHSVSRAGGGHTVSRSGGGHRVSGGSFGGGSSRGSYGPSGGMRTPMRGPSNSGRYGRSAAYGPDFGRTRPRNDYGTNPGPVYNGGYGGPGGARRSGCGCLTAVLVIAALLAFMLFASMLSGFSLNNGNTGGSSGSIESTKNREKLSSGYSYMSDCLAVEADGWFESGSGRTKSALKDFWSKTGVQPYIYIKAYDEELQSDSEKEAWAYGYYDESFGGREDGFLYIYFDEGAYDTGNGYMYYVLGSQAESVMDGEAVEIFWSNIDRYWMSDLSDDELFAAVFEKTAETIMERHTTSADVAKQVAIGLTVVALGVIAIIIISKRNRRAKEKAEEDRRILETPLRDQVEDELEKKYL